MQNRSQSLPLPVTEMFKNIFFLHLFVADIYLHTLVEKIPKHNLTLR